MFVQVLLTAAAVLGAPHTCYHHPVAAPVVEAFAAPECRWCPGNRGLDYATRAGEAVHAAGPGRVAFAGSVAGRGWVTIAHADGLRTSYGPLARILVRAGTPVPAGQVIGRAAGRLHVGVRRGEHYLDPGTVFSPPARWRPRLVPLEGAAPPRPLPRCVSPQPLQPRRQPSRASAGVR